MFQRLYVAGQMNYGNLKWIFYQLKPEAFHLYPESLNVATKVKYLATIRHFLQWSPVRIPA